MEKHSIHGPAIVRIGMSLVFLWFGVNQWLHPSMWMGLVPHWISAIVSASVVVHTNGLFEILAGLCLLVGFQIRIVAILLCLHLIGIASTFGLSATGVRDFGLAIATLSIFFTGMDVWSVDTKFLGSTMGNEQNL